MSRTERWLLDISNLLVGGTGITYGVMRYLMESPDEWAVVNHPWQPHVQHLHVLAVPLLVFACGLLWSGHVVSKLIAHAPRGRITGLALIVQLIPMVFSGYLIQVSVSEGWRTIWIWVHLVTSFAWIMMTIVHRFRIPDHCSTDVDRKDNEVRNPAQQGLKTGESPSEIQAAASIPEFVTLLVDENRDRSWLKRRRTIVIHPKRSRRRTTSGPSKSSHEG